MQGKFIYCRTVVSIIAVTLSAVQGGPDSGFAIVLILFALNGAVLNYEWVQEAVWSCADEGQFERTTEWLGADGIYFYETRCSSFLLQDKIWAALYTYTAGGCGYCDAPPRQSVLSSLVTMRVVPYSLCQRYWYWRIWTPDAWLTMIYSVPCLQSLSGDLPWDLRTMVGYSSVKLGVAQDCLAV